MKIVLAALFALLVSACSSLPQTISADAPVDGIAVKDATVVNDLKSAAYNLDQAVAIGVLDATDPAPFCLHDVLKKTGVDSPPAASFAPKYDGVASAGAVAYIEAQKLKKLQGKGLQIDVSCEALVGRIVIDSVNAANKAAAALPGVRGAATTVMQGLAAH